MIARLQYVLSSLVALLLSFSLQADSGKADLLQQLYQKAGLDVHMRTLQASLWQSCQAYEGRVEDGLFDAVCSSDAIKIHPDQYRQRVLAHLSQRLGKEQLQQVLSWLGSPLGRRIAHMENMVEPIAVTVYIRQKLAAAPPRQIRSELIDTLIFHLGAVEISTQIASSSALEIAERVNDQLPDDRRMDLGAIEQALQQQMSTMSAATHQDLHQRFLYTYRTLPDEELQAYVNFAGSETMQRFYGGVFEALGEML